MDSSYPYSPPQMPGRRRLEDMIVWYATMDIRAELWDPESDLVTELIDQVLELLATWRPTTDLHVSYVKAGRVLDWMVWSTVSAADESMAASYTDEDCLEPWGIKIDTLPRYGQLPASYRRPDPPAEPDPRVIVIPIEDLMSDPGDR